MNDWQRDKADLIAQWAFDTRPILGRFHLWLDDVEVEWVRGEPAREFTREISFMGGKMERMFAMMAAVTALGTQIFGRYGEGVGLDRHGLNQVKKDADAISAYAMSESLWYLSRHLPENHAILVCLGEGLMPKAGETPEMGSNPQLGFGRVYARPEVARQVDGLVMRLLNEPGFVFDDFYEEVHRRGITLWGAAIDTLENTSRFAKGATSGPLTVIHVFDQPLRVSRPYEGYVGNLILPRELVDKAAEQSVLINFRTPRALVLQAIEQTWPGIRRPNVHVWSLGGRSRVARIGGLWEEWRREGVHVVEDGWILPSGLPAFTESGTYAPTFSVGSWTDDGGEVHLFIVDGYAASAEAMQAASLGPMLGLDVSMCVFTSRFNLSYERERDVMRLDPTAPGFEACLGTLLGADPDPATADLYRAMIQEAAGAGLPVWKPVLSVDDFFPEKAWEVLAINGYMLPDPYSGAPGVEPLGEGRYRVCVRLATARGDKRIHFMLRLMESAQESRLVFNPLLNRFLAGEDFQNRAVKISDSGRIRNELQTLCVEALEFLEGNRVRIHFDRIPVEVISRNSQRTLLEVLTWYQTRHPRWFSWLELVLPSGGDALS
ncbi:MAG: hypothetical protein JXB39_11000 [Deltaproteobacteria bacterium]|nr:hypothetical protein [Deltaproteobacteria bacterium]